nr:anti-phage ZorAB system protein ZorA [Caulobacter sp. SLTY]
MLGVAGWLHWCARKELNPYLKAARARVEALNKAIGPDSDPVVSREQFAANYLDVSAAMGKEEPGAQALVQAWREFQESIIDEDASPIRNTNRPSAFFNRVAPRLAYLTFASNVFVGIGLILTFLGLIVALGQASKGMGNSDIGASKLALQGLLTVAGAKFFSSVAGLGASIWLRFAEHGLSKKSKSLTDSICTLLEHGLLYVPPQRLAVEQLEILKEQRDQLKMFNTDFAMQLGEKIGSQFQQAFDPVAASITRMADTMNDVTSGIGDGARKAIEEVSGDQLRGLSEVLATLGLKIEQISTAVGSSGDEAARQIRDAGADFSRAASDIREAFDRLAGQVDGMGANMRSQSEAAAKAQDETLHRVLSELSQAQAKSAEAMNEAVDGLKRAGLEAAATMQSEVQSALASGVAESQKVFAHALEESGGELRTTALGLAKAVGDAAESIDRASDGFARSGQQAERSAEALSNVSGQANTLVSAIEEARRGFGAVATPIVKAVEAVDGAVARIQAALQAGQVSDEKAMAEMRGLAEQMKQTYEAAEEAWSEYRARFAEVDKSLAQAAEKMSSTLGDSLNQFASFAQKTDGALADAVGKLDSGLSPIQDLADSLVEYAEKLDGYANSRRPVSEPAE